ncbi:hypothetical protein [Burkholderia arboris]|uniref:hypothetical protein n=1 Tax=Burkholderia arboris TaxID=488730 RepID=UPI001CF29FD3|nr:hypothetical protein [Burkholderia arboris]MCA8050821.1 hypothetical protein [Burkholderia arboris]CAJ6631058.1 Uncharacterised protein [Burkholderia pseudomallei]CAJ6700696.1 Uncharacterised protein [Burkholderia pseudomallei]
MKTHKHRAILLGVLATVLAGLGFYAMFRGNTNHFVAGGIAVAMFSCFFVAFNRAWEAFEASRVDVLTADVRGR